MHRSRASGSRSKLVEVACARKMTPVAENSILPQAGKCDTQQDSTSWGVALRFDFELASVLHIALGRGLAATKTGAVKI